MVNKYFIHDERYVTHPPHIAAAAESVKAVCVAPTPNFTTPEVDIDTDKKVFTPLSCPQTIVFIPVAGMNLASDDPIVNDIVDADVVVP